MLNIIHQQLSCEHQLLKSFGLTGGGGGSTTQPWGREKTPRRPNSRAKYQNLD